MGRNPKAQHPAYWSWQTMIQRCTNPNRPWYKHYGGRGIEVCPEWRASFEAFSRDMGPRPSKAHSLERLDNEKGYFPGNCVWATINEQRRNTRYTKKLSFNGKTQAIQSWAEELGIKAATIAARVRSGWTVEQALSLPVGSRRKEHKLAESMG